MEPDKRMKLADLMYGHEGKFICHLSGRFDPQKYPGAPPIQICQMKCGCWIVGDGNNRVGLMLRKNPEAAIADIPRSLLAIALFGEWDSEMMDSWNPCAKSFRDAMTKRIRKSPESGDTIYGLIEREDEGRFYAYINSNKKVTALSAAGRTADEVQRLLEEKTRTMLKRERVRLVLTPTNPLENHQCSLQS